jgi:hypothetical protein
LALLLLLLLRRCWRWRCVRACWVAMGVARQCPCHCLQEHGIIGSAITQSTASPRLRPGDLNRKEGENNCQIVVSLLLLLQQVITHLSKPQTWA